MYCSTKSSISILLWNTMIVTIGFLVMHFLCYGVKDPSSYSRSLSEILITIAVALVYAYLFNKISYNWRVDYAAGFVHVKQGGSHQCGNSVTNFSNAVIFAVLVSSIVILVMSLTGMLVSTMYVFILDGIRGAVPPEDTDSALALVGQIVVATVAVELLGKTEGQPR